MLSLLYECILWATGVLMLPKLLYQYIFIGKYRSSLWQRFGMGLPTIDKGAKPLIWLHAVSVGEIKAAARLIQALQSQTGSVLVISSTTETGQAEARRAVPGADFFIYMPFDFKFLMARIVPQVKPDYVLISESDLWLNFVQAAKREGAFVALVNGKISATSSSRLSKIPYFTNALFGAVDLLCVQNELYAARFRQLQVPPHKIKVTGNLKFDATLKGMHEDERDAFKTALSIAPDSQVVVVGSTHDGEEEALLQVFMSLRPKLPHLQLVLVPRHPERFEVVAELLERLGLPFCRYGQPNEAELRPIVLVDRMGLLEKCYQIAHLAIVAGSYTEKVGGHNILEPLWFDVPLIFGPYMAAQPELLSTTQHYGAGLQIPIEALAENIPHLLNDAALRLRLQSGGRQLIAEMQGSTSRTLRDIECGLKIGLKGCR